MSGPKPSNPRAVLMRIKANASLSQDKKTFFPSDSTVHGHKAPPIPGAYKRSTKKIQSLCMTEESDKLQALVGKMAYEVRNSPFMVKQVRIPCVDSLQTIKQNLKIQEVTGKSRKALSKVLTLVRR